eukprot:5087037-Pleurochrysis_carterae.AAC.2
MPMHDEQCHDAPEECPRNAQRSAQDAPEEYTGKAQRSARTCPFGSADATPPHDASRGLEDKIGIWIGNRLPGMKRFYAVATCVPQKCAYLTESGREYRSAGHFWRTSCGRTCASTVVTAICAFQGIEQTKTEPASVECKTSYTSGHVDGAASFRRA